MSEPANFDAEKALQNIQELEQQVSKISEQLQNLKSNIQTEPTPQSEQLNIIVTDIEQLDRIIRDRQDVGH